MKKKLITGLLTVLALAGEAAAQSNTNREYTTFATESITVAGTAIGFTAATIAPVGAAYRARLATFVVECSASSPCPIRVLTTGSNPTSTVGLKLNEGDSIAVYGYDDISNFKAIRTGANSAIIQPLYSR